VSVGAVICGWGMVGPLPKERMPPPPPLLKKSRNLTAQQNQSWPAGRQAHLMDVR
jgi:hypothetical protein